MEQEIPAQTSEPLTLGHLRISRFLSEEPFQQSYTTEIYNKNNIFYPPPPLQNKTQQTMRMRSRGTNF